MGRTLRVGLVVSDWPGFSVASGISSASESLVTNLREAGLELHVMIPEIGNGAVYGAKKRFPGVSFYSFQELHHVYPPYLSRQWDLWRTVDALALDAVISQDWRGYCSYMSAVGSRPPLITWVHGGTLYTLEGENRYFASASEALDASLERIQIENSDLVVGPSEFLLERYRSLYRYSLGRTSRIAYHLPPLNLGSDRTRASTSERCFAFVGRLSRRKNPDEFIKFVELANKVVGKSKGIVVGEGDISRPLPKKRASDDSNLEYWGLLTRDKLWSRLRQQCSTLVVTSRLDNSPYVVQEAIAAGLAVIVVGANNGAKELASEFESVRSFASLETIDWENLPPSPPELERVAKVGGDFNANITESWLNLIRSVVTGAASTASVEAVGGSHADVSFVVTTHNRPQLLLEALESLVDQNVKPREVVVVDDNSGRPVGEEALRRNFPSLNLRYHLNEKNLGPSASRNLGAGLATSTYLGFLDDDNVLHPDHIELALESLQSGHHCTVSTLAVSTNSRWSEARPTMFFGGVGASISVQDNLIGDTHFVCRKDIFYEAGGFPELPITGEDVSILLRMRAIGAKIATTGRPTVLYRASSGGIEASRRPEFLTQLIAGRELLQSGGVNLDLFTWTAARGFWPNFETDSVRTPAQIEPVLRILRKRPALYAFVRRTYRQWIR